jgi:hypothetical protein
MSPFALIVGGVLLMIGAALPWLTLYAGLHQYGGMIGEYGQAVFAAGAAAVVGGIVALRVRPPWLRLAGAAFGVAVFAFGLWLYVGLRQFVNRPEALMFVPQAGPGLFVVLLGAAVVAIGSQLPLHPKPRGRVYSAAFRISRRRG